MLRNKSEVKKMLKFDRAQRSPVQSMGTNDCNWEFPDFPILFPFFHIFVQRYIVNL